MQANQYFIVLLLPFLLCDTIAAKGIRFWRSARQLLVVPSYEYPELGMELHNDVRDEHSSPPLKLNMDLQAAAQSHANYLINMTKLNAYRMAEPESSNNASLVNYSQNVHLTYNEVAAEKFTVAVFLAMAHWYDEESQYDYNSPKMPSNFTRMIWKSSTEVGFGVATTGNSTIVVANYWPAPPEIDIQSEAGMEIYKMNVLPPKDEIKYGKDTRFRV